MTTKVLRDVALAFILLDVYPVAVSTGVYRKSSLARLVWCVQVAYLLMEPGEGASLIAIEIFGSI